MQLKTDFGPDGPQPGTVAYTAFIMAQLCPGGDDDDPDFWDRWKEELKDSLPDEDDDVRYNFN